VIGTNITIRRTRHANAKINQRKIAFDNIKAVILKPEFIEKDKFDDSLHHFIGIRNERFLRVIGRWESKKDLLVISAFYDRRLKKRGRHDKD
jgi:hypothetical protein